MLAHGRTIAPIKALAKTATARSRGRAVCRSCGATADQHDEAVSIAGLGDARLQAPPSRCKNNRNKGSAAQAARATQQSRERFFSIWKIGYRY
jgi:hypothetical protein